MKKTLKKKSLTKNNTQKNNKGLVKKCVDTFVKNRVNKTLRDFNKQLKEYESKESDTFIKLMKSHKKNIPKMETASNKLVYCNIGCKDTILEPGLPDYVPTSMLKDDDNGFRLKMLKEQRKKIFKNKTNVLVDNFYEGVSSKAKNKLIKDGAISKCSIYNEIN